ncbi:MAG: sigma-70 family RNA polymerase sigma factor [Bacteroidota bacterium]
MNKFSEIQKISDNILVDKYKSTKDAIYLGELYQRHTSFVFAVSMKYLKDRDAASDAVIEIFEKLITDLMRFEIENFRAWLHRVTQNHCLLIIRSNKYHQKHNEQYKNDMQVFMEKDSDLYHELGNSKEEILVVLEQGIENLNDEQKKCIELFYLKEKCYNEIAETTGYSLKNVKSYIQNGKRNLKIFMEKNQHISNSFIKIFLMVFIFNRIL